MVLKPELKNATMSTHEISQLINFGTDQSLNSLHTPFPLIETNPVGGVDVVDWRLYHYRIDELGLQFTETFIGDVVIGA